MNTQTPPSIVSGLLRPKETMNIIGKKNCGKGALALDLALCVASGTPWCDIDCDKGKVLYVSTEHDAGGLSYRIAHLLRSRKYVAGKPYISNFDVLAAKSSLRGNAVLDVCGCFASKTGYKLIVIDSLTRVQDDAARQNERDAVQAIHDRLDKIANETGCAFALVQHLSEDKTMAAADDLSLNYSALAADTNLFIIRDVGENDYIAKPTARSFPQPKRMYLHKEWPFWALQKH